VLLESGAGGIFVAQAFNGSTANFGFRALSLFAWATKHQTFSLGCWDENDFQIDFCTNHAK
jgi:hypothetical protein